MATRFLIGSLCTSTVSRPPVLLPNSGIQTTQLGHVKDLATAFIQVLGNEKASKEVFNIAGDKYVTFDGLARPVQSFVQITFQVFFFLAWQSVRGLMWLLKLLI